MKNIHKSLISIAVSSALLVAACSSSSDPSPENTMVNDPANGSITTDDTGAPITTDGTGDSTIAGGTDGSADTPTDGVGAPVGTGSLNLATAYPKLLDALSGYQLETLAEEIMLIGDSISAGSEGSVSTVAGSFSVNDRDRDVVTETQIVTYNCDAGGTVTIELGQLTIAESSYSRVVENDRYAFDQCETTAGGSQRLNGIVSSLQDSTSGSRFSRTNYATTWGAFSRDQDGGQRLTADATISGNALSSFDSSDTRTATINEYSMSRGDRIAMAVSNGLFSQQNETIASGAAQRYNLDISGQVTDESGIASNIVAQPALSRLFVQPAVASESLIPEPFSGEINISADNGSQILLTATEPGDSYARQVDVFHRAVDGSTSTLKAQNFQTFGAEL